MANSKREPLTQLLEIPPEKVIGLTVNSNRLLGVRESRLHAMGGVPLEDYVDRREVAKELRFADALMESHHWRLLDVSYMAAEEVARHVRNMIGK